MAQHTIRRGLDLPLAGAPSQQIEDAPAVARVALLGADYPGLKPTVLVQAGDRVLRGSPLLRDKPTGAQFTSPAAGTVAAVNRGERRALISVVVEVGEDDGVGAQVRFAAGATSGTGRLTELLVDSGLWCALRTRPYGQLASPAVRPTAIFVTAIDTRPHAPAVATVLAGREQDFSDGVAALARLTDGTVFVCCAPGAAPTVAQDARVQVETFAGPHPAGLPGTHIHLLAPVGHDRTVWYIGYQDVAAIGRLVGRGELDVSRVVALAGPGVARPRLLRTRLGASVDALVERQMLGGRQRVISGSVLDGRIAAGRETGFLGRYHQQIAVVPEGGERELFGWIAPSSSKFSIWNVVAGAVSRRPLKLDTSTNGGRRAMVPIGAYERVMPLDILPTFLLRALLVRDDERAEALGALELEEDDLALCTFVSPGKQEYGPLLRDALARLQKESA